MRHSSRFLVCTLFALASSGCTIAADLDSFVSVDSIGCDMEMAVQGFSPHPTHAVVFQAVTRDAAQELRAMAIFDPMVFPDRSFRMPNAVAGGAQALHFWADVDDDGRVMTSPVGSDHSWRFDDVCNIPSTCMDGDVEVPNCFAHASPFDDLRDPALPGGTLTLELTGLEASDVGFVEVRLVEVDEGAQLRRVVGLYRSDRRDDASPSLRAVLPGLIDLDRTYTVDVLVDRDQSGEIEVAMGEVFALGEQEGRVYDDPRTLDVTEADMANALPEEGILVATGVSSSSEEGITHSH